MASISRFIDVVAQMGAFATATIVVGANGMILGQYDRSTAFIVTEAVAISAMITSVARMFVSRPNVLTVLWDLLQMAAWAVSSAFLADEIREINGCGFTYYHLFNFPQGGQCGLSKTAVVCAILSVIAWFFPFVVGVFMTYSDISDRIADRKSSRNRQRQSV